MFFKNRVTGLILFSIGIGMLIISILPKSGVGFVLGVILLCIGLFLFRYC